MFPGPTEAIISCWLRIILNATITDHRASSAQENNSVHISDVSVSSTAFYIITEFHTLADSTAHTLLFVSLSTLTYPYHGLWAGMSLSCQKTHFTWHSLSFA